MKINEVINEELDEGWKSAVGAAAIGLASMGNAHSAGISDLADREFADLDRNVAMTQASKQPPTLKQMAIAASRSFSRRFSKAEIVELQSLSEKYFQQMVSDMQVKGRQLSELDYTRLRSKAESAALTDYVSRLQRV